MNRPTTRGRTCCVRSGLGDKWIRGFPDLLPHTGGGLFATRDLAGSATSCCGEEVERNAGRARSLDHRVHPTTRDADVPVRRANVELWVSLVALHDRRQARRATDLVIAASGAGAVALRGPELRSRGGDQRGYPERPGSALSMVFGTILPAMR
jgi:hypothetical protein